MHTNTLTVEVNVPIEELFKYTTEPWNTHMWIDAVVAEDCDHWPPEDGVSTYRNKDEDGVWTSYVLTAYELNTLFELTRDDGVYAVRYTYAALGENLTELTYHEWVNEGEIEKPFPQAALNKLKKVLEISV